MANLTHLCALHISHAGAWLWEDGAARAIDRQEAKTRALAAPLLLVNTPLVGGRLGYNELSGLDLLELFAFVHPARFVIPSPAGLAEATGLPAPASDADAAALLPQIAERLLATLSSSDWPERQGAWTAGRNLERARWPWGAFIRAALPAHPGTEERWLFSALPEWEDQAPRPPARQGGLIPHDIDDQLDTLVGQSGEIRSGQRAFAQAVAGAFAPRDQRDAPHIVLAEAGTGIGKTLGYLAPASLWAAQSGGSVWVSTFTKALQRQLNRESARIYPDDVQRRRRVAIRKGRENYLCLLNLEEALHGGASGGRGAIFAQLVARWAAYSRDGDMVGGDLPGWLPTLFRRTGTAALTDRRGECIYAGCPHYRRCFIERATRASSQADIVIANHALVLVEAVRGRGETQARYVFDEGHHLFHAADSTFSLALSGAEAIELRRWVIGPEGSRKGRRRGLSARLADVASYDDAAGQAIEAAVQAAKLLPADEWLSRITGETPQGPLEALLVAVRSMTLARAEESRRGMDGDPGYGLEAELVDPFPALVEAAQAAGDALATLLDPLRRLDRRLDDLVGDPPDWLDGESRNRIEGSRMALGRRCDTLAGWIALLTRIGGPGEPEFVDWLAVDRFDGREYDVALRRHWLDPTRPLADHVLKPAHGALITSATLRAGGDWGTARALTGASHLDRAPEMFSAESPFDYANQSEVLIVTDIKKGDTAALASAYTRLIEASGGGALGLFSAIRRLRAVHARIADRLARSGLPLLAQHVDPIDIGTLVDLFRADPHASLLGTDALRDGIDVPGDTLRLVIMEGIPWPKPSVLHAARRLAWDGSAYNDRLVRAKLAQAFGRLIRRQDDRGVFVLLSSAVPSRMLTAFPPGVAIRRLSLDEAIASVRSFLTPGPTATFADSLPEFP
ncbi:MAG TPA: ATP-dependent DNA helicase [Sphingobium sp.]|uniref:ATP-dependent DNA helicase n=1 Tax=Sphingobium sp. TaxID=1912891 RepID=UPI002ED4BF59